MNLHPYPHDGFLEEFADAFSDVRRGLWLVIRGLGALILMPLFIVLVGTALAIAWPTIKALDWLRGVEDRT